MENETEEGKSIKNNGIWTNTTVNIPELIATYLKVWLEDAVPVELTKGIETIFHAYDDHHMIDFKRIVERRYSDFTAAAPSICAR